MKLALKILTGLVVALALTVIGVFAALLVTADRPARPVGFAQLTVQDPQDKPLDVGIWYPTDSPPGFSVIGLSAQRVASNGPVVGRELPLIVISHGNGGLFSSHSDTALALASAGFVVTAPTHTGDNARDDAYVGTERWLIDRPRHVHLVLNYMLNDWPARGHLNPARIGMFGFSAGGFTALVSAGGVPDIVRIGSHCRKTPEFACTLWKQLPSESVPATAWLHDARITAVAVAAPGYGFAFEPEGLSRVTAAVQIWSGVEDHNVPYETNAAVVRRLLSTLPEYHAVPGAGHFSFLAPCPSWLFPVICKDAKDFDRVVFHGEFNQSLVAFYRSQFATR